MTTAEPIPDAGEPAAPSLRARVVSLTRQSGVYLVANALGRGVGLILVPLYANVMDPAEYGGLAVALSINGLLIIVLGLSLHAAITRLHVEAESEEERGQLYLTVVIFLLVAPGVFCLAVEGVGRTGALDLSDGLPWDPVLSLTMWASYLGIFLYVPQAIYINRQEPRKVLMLTLGSALLTVVVTVWLVLIEDQGLPGALRALVISSGALALVSIALVLRMSAMPPRGRLLKVALVFALPLIPHSVAQWLLNLSDRIVLERFVPEADVGVYSLGYQLGLVVAIVVSGIAAGLTPMILAQLKDPRTRSQVPHMGTYVLLAVTVTCVAVAVTSDEVIAWVAPGDYAEAAEIAPWVVLGYGFYGAYAVWSHGTWYSMKTYWIPVITLLAATLNVGLNLVFVPRYGIKAAAIDTAIGFAALALMHAYVAHRLFPIAWEWMRAAKLLAAGTACFVLAAAVEPASAVPAFLVGLLIAGIALPVVLLLLGFWTPAERAAVGAYAARLRARGGG